ncbi:hypothetical protein EVAR_99824_1 [Eumeta japonica]|uniref:Uncharacterized protein n=1 Tax=Eumeta variegata TaxID=151549 RepID=A0A4C1ZZQ7_EUMVA|nr:hypothetical protein EVAR_99824_1 [Eumeta japonica]
MLLHDFITEILYPSSTSIVKPWIASRDKVYVETNRTGPNSMGLCHFITEFLWPPSSSIIRRWIPYSNKVLVKKNHKPKLDGVATFHYGVSMATSQSHHQITSMSSQYCIIMRHTNVCKISTQSETGEGR